VRHGAELVVIAGGPVLYLLGSVGLKLRVLQARWERRLVAAVLVVAATALGHGLPGLALWTIVLAILAALAAGETIEARRARPGRWKPAAAS
jgi:hypothetical protein